MVKNNGTHFLPSYLSYMCMTILQIPQTQAGYKLRRIYTVFTIDPIVVEANTLLCSH